MYVFDVGVDNKLSNQKRWFWSMQAGLLNSATRPAKPLAIEVVGTAPHVPDLSNSKMTDGMKIKL
jgi:hypothetical protein